MPTRFAAALLVAATEVSAQRTVLGFEFLAPFPLPKTQCTTDDLVHSRRSCLLGQVTRAAKHTLATVFIPDDGQRAQWAAYGTFQVLLDHSGHLLSLSVRVRHCSRTEVVSSISQRFGHPVRANLSSRLQGSAHWASPHVQTSLLHWNYDECSVEFREAAYAAAQQAAADAAAAKRSPGP